MSGGRRVKVLLVIDSLGSGGAQNQMTLLAQALSRRGYAIELFTYYADSFFAHRLAGLPIETHHYAKREKLGLSVVWALKKLFDRHHYDVVISYLTTPNLYVTSAKRIAVHRPKVICSYRSMTPFPQLGLMRLKMMEWVNRNADHLVTNSVHERRRWQERYPDQAMKWSTIYNGVIPHVEGAPTQEREERAIDLLVVGSISPFKNGLLVVEALSLLLKEGLEVHLTWVGQKMRHIPERRKYLEEMERRIAERGLGDHWTWREPTEDIYSYYQNCDGLILASTTEGLPNVVCEAMYQGTICIVSRVLDHPLIIEEGASGFLVDPKSPEELAAKIKILKSLAPSQRQQLAARARDFAEAHFSIDKMAFSYQKLIDALCSS